MQGWGSCDPGSIPGTPTDENLVQGKGGFLPRTELCSGAWVVPVQIWVPRPKKKGRVASPLLE